MIELLAASTRFISGLIGGLVVIVVCIILLVLLIVKGRKD